MEWLFGLLLAVVGILILLTPSFRAFLAAHAAFVALLLIGAACVLAWSAAANYKVGVGLRKIAGCLTRRGDGLPDPLPAVAPSALLPLVEGVKAWSAYLGDRVAAATDTMVSNRALVREVSRTRQLLDGLRDGLLLLDTSANVVLANRAAGDFLLCPHDEAAGRPAAECLRDEAVLHLISEGGLQAVGHGLHTVELPAVPDSGRVETAVSHCHAFAEDGGSVGHVLLFRDGSRSKNSERLQTDFVDSMAHELRTPLTSISAYVQMLIEGGADEETRRSFCTVIYEETCRLSNLIDNLLNISMIETGSVQLDIKPVRLRGVVEDCMEVVALQCQEKGVRLALDLPDHVPTFALDKRLFGVALMNVLGNATKYTPEGGTVTISAVSGETDFRLQVRDTGIGIAPEALPRVFEKFFRADNANEQASGSGVGLATALQIVQHHGGDIEVESKQGQGTVFTIVLPSSLINTT